VNKRDMRIRKVSIIPLEVVTRNIVAGSLAKRLGIPEGTRLEAPIVEFYYKKDELGDPLVTEDHVKLLKAATDAEMQELRRQALLVNDALKELWSKCGLDLVDFKLEFGYTMDDQILLADEISPDTQRLWDTEGRKMDKDVFRRDLGDLVSVYQEVYDRMIEAWPQLDLGELAEAPANS
jgi:phosphoribosylaminoimidazole-succinocarboxamide synthase